MYYEETFRVDSRDVDPFDQCRPSAMLGFLQEAAVTAACELHVSREETIREYNAFWMLLRMWYRLDRPLHWNESFTVRTWHRGSKGVSMYRDFDLWQNGRPVGEAVSVWVLADVDTHKLFRLRDVSQFEGTDGGKLCKDRLLPNLRIPVSLAPVADRPLHYSDADINGHVNNTRYADFACDAIGLDVLGTGKYVSELQIGYRQECRPGDLLHLSAGQEGPAWYVRGADGEDRPHFDASLTLSPLDNPGAGV